MGPIVGREDQFEATYREKFRDLCREHGEFIHYERDRCSLDFGLHLTEVAGGDRRVSHTRIWFQMKGIHRETLTLEEFELGEDVKTLVKLDHLKFWFASPEPVYLVVYVESADAFFAEDVRDLVYACWGEEFLEPSTFHKGQEKVTVRLSKDAEVTTERLKKMRRHQSMRIDGPFFRGRPLGHRLDPLRCQLGKIEPTVYSDLVSRLLEVHDYRISERLDVERVFGTGVLRDEHASLTLGKLHNTYEWIPQLFTEFGVAPDDDFRSEGAPERAHGQCAVLVHGSVLSSPETHALQAFGEYLVGRNIRRLLVFANTDDSRCFGFYGGIREIGVSCMPQLLGDLAYSLLTATVVYLEFRESISWSFVNYL